MLVKHCTKISNSRCPKKEVRHLLWTTDVEMHTPHCDRCDTGIERVTKSTRDVRGDEPYVKN